MLFMLFQAMTILIGDTALPLGVFAVVFEKTHKCAVAMVRQLIDDAAFSEVVPYALYIPEHEATGVYAIAIPDWEEYLLFLIDNANIQYMKRNSMFLCAHMSDEVRVELCLRFPTFAPIFGDEPVECR